MRFTLLGTGDVLGVPPPFQTLADANAAARRRRCGALIETETTTLLLDVPPEFRDGIRQADVGSVDAAFVTHWHHDHVGGIDDLALTARFLDIPLYLTATAQDRFAQEKPYLTDSVAIRNLMHGEPVTVGDIEITPIPVAHDRPECDTLAFRLETGTETMVYAPDFENWCPDMPGGKMYTNADLAVLEATPAIAPELLSSDVPTPDPVTKAAASRTVLTHLNEYMLGKSTATLEAMAAEEGYELGEDFASYTA
ncbi:metal-dependent hydrolase [Halogeometricum borinquense DSM 11551]|uniref:Metal-dependent hydrolase n=2 Tax=Halogeometricum borinquense TaxID=60847 RepID=E4NPV0_HALBP|nr:MBL fold metallo-hydrolase [Halogeometricum borinquense]ADQ66583.1 metal-dependent hydrolase, beta-lactamase superfamily I [Halogeometricum borinquense DSM 11551]ELY30691.1 metal-dependent hydrolase [Halogeometricum borinquense DSM 11551]RYJ14440.1 MBL fold metallo-hydrolase [Halogeometricum borinquense]